MDELWKIAKDLPDSWERAWAGNGDRIVIVKTSRGLSKCYGLHKRDDAASCICVSTAGTVYPIHAHDAVEYAAVKSGKLKVYMLGKIHVFGENDFFLIPKGEPHIVHFIEDTELFVTSFPAIPEFPGGGRFSYERYGFS